MYSRTARSVVAAVFAAAIALANAQEPPTMCSGTVRNTSPAGTISTASYASNANCVWMIETSYNAITVDFSFFELEMGYDFVRIYDGTQANPARLITMLTGKDTPHRVSSGSGSMLIVLSADHSVNSGGFSATYTASNPSPSSLEVTALSSRQRCKGNTRYTSDTAIISDGDGNYVNSASCEWTITPADSNLRFVTLELSSFDLENTYDYLRVYDGELPGGRLLGAFTGSVIPAPITSTTGTMYLQLSADSSVVSSGFTGVYTTSAIAPAPVQGPSVLAAPTYNDGTNGAPCHGTVPMTTLTGVLSSGHSHGSQSYQNGASCRWEISAGMPNSAILLQFSAFATEYVYDHVQVYDGPTLLGQWSGFANPGQVTARSGRMIVVFSSDGSVAHGGFTASYHVTSAAGESESSALIPFVVSAPIAANGYDMSAGACAGVPRELIGRMGFVSSGPNGYMNNANCQWLIQGPTDSQITLTFQQFDMEDFYDWVWVYDGADRSAHVAGKFSGNALPSAVTASSGSMLIVLTSDSSVAKNGFSASYMLTSGTAGAN